MSRLQLQILGCANAWAAPAEAGWSTVTSGYLLQSEITKILLDCGHGVLSRLRTVDHAHELDAVFLSHLHSDHCGDLVSLAYYLQYHPHERAADWSAHRIPLYIPQGTLTKLHAYADAVATTSVFDDAFIVTEYSPEEAVNIGDLLVNSAWMVHDVPCLALDVRHCDNDGARITYSADTAPCEAIVTLATGSPLLLMEATIPEDGDNHTCARTAGVIAAKAHVDRLWLVHVCDAFDSEWVLQQAKDGCVSAEYDPVNGIQLAAHIDYPVSLL